MSKLVSIDDQNKAGFTLQSLRATIFTLQTCLSITRECFRLHSTFARLYNAAASPASPLCSASSLAIIMWGQLRLAIGLHVLYVILSPLQRSERSLYKSAVRREACACTHITQRILSSRKKTFNLSLSVRRRVYMASIIQTPQREGCLGYPRPYK